MTSQGIVTRSPETTALASQADVLMPAAAMTKVFVVRGYTPQIIGEVVRTFRAGRGQVKNFAPLFRADSLERSLRTLWAFVREQIRYVEDPDGQQLLKEPARIWADRKADCKGYSIFIGSVLSELGIPFAFRFVGDQQYSHVYVVTRTRPSYVLDACLPEFNVEPPYTISKDLTMATNIYRLAGPGGVRWPASNPVSGACGCRPAGRAHIGRSRLIMGPQPFSPALRAWNDERASNRPLPMPVLRPRVGKVDPATAAAAAEKANSLLEKVANAVGGVFKDIFGPCGWLSGWDQDSRVQLARYNSYASVAGLPLITGKDPECNWRQTPLTGRAVLDLDAEGKAIIAQAYATRGAEFTSRLLNLANQIYDGYLNRRDPVGSMGQMMDLRQNIIREWTQQSRGDSGGLTASFWLYIDALRKAGQELGFNLAPNVGGIPYSQAISELKAAEGSSARAGGGPGALVPIAAGLALTLLTR